MHFIKLHQGMVLIVLIQQNGNCEHEHQDPPLLLVHRQGLEDGEPLLA